MKTSARRNTLAVATTIVALAAALWAVPAASRDRGANQPGAAGNRGRDAGVNQPGAAGNRS